MPGQLCHCLEKSLSLLWGSDGLQLRWQVAAAFISFLPTVLGSGVSNAEGVIYHLTSLLNLTLLRHYSDFTSGETEAQEVAFAWAGRRGPGL